MALMQRDYVSERPVAKKEEGNMAAPAHGQHRK